MPVSERLFNETPTGTYVPRALFVDLCPQTIDTVASTADRGKVPASQLICGRGGSGGNYARSYLSLSPPLKERLSEGIRKLAEPCSSLEGFLISHSFGGGTGSGLTASVVQHLNFDYGKRSLLDFPVYPALQTSPLLVEPYNGILMTDAIIDNTSCSFILDNLALRDMVLKTCSVDWPTNTEMNLIIARLLDLITSTMRQESSLNRTTDELRANLVPFPRLHFIVGGLSPLSVKSPTELWDGTLECFRPTNQVVRCALERAPLLSCCLTYRGDLQASDVDDLGVRVQATQDLRFVDWSPCEFKIGLVRGNGPQRPQKRHDVCLLRNSCAIHSLFTAMTAPFDVMFAKRAFLHWFLLEGLEPNVFLEARETMASVIQDYEDAASESVNFESVSAEFSHLRMQ
ncbi:Tubulin is the major constituent of microtubules [Sparganum proliferum]